MKIIPGASTLRRASMRSRSAEEPMARPAHSTEVQVATQRRQRSVRARAAAARAHQADSAAPALAPPDRWAEEEEVPSAAVEEVGAARWQVVAVVLLAAVADQAHPVAVADADRTGRNLLRSDLLRSGDFCGQRWTQIQSSAGRHGQAHSRTHDGEARNEVSPERVRRLASDPVEP